MKIVPDPVDDFLLLGDLVRPLGEIQEDPHDFGIELDPGLAPDEAILERLDEQSPIRKELSIGKPAIVSVHHMASESKHATAKRTR